MIQVINDGQKFPFSKGILARSISSTGLSVSEAYKIVWTIRDNLMEEGIREISSGRLKELVVEELSERGYEREAKYYRLRSKLNSIEQPIFCLFGGGTGVGKTTIGAEIGHRMGINRVIGTDTIREILRGILPPRLLPTLHTSTFLAMDELRTHLVSNRLIYAFEQQVNLVTEGLISVINRGNKEGLSMVLDGVHIVPGLIKSKMEIPPENLFEYVIDVPDREKHRKLFYAREEGSKREAERYLDNFGRIRDIHRYICDRAEENDVKVIENLSFSHAVDEIMDDIFSRLEEKEMVEGMPIN